MLDTMPVSTSPILTHSESRTYRIKQKEQKRIHDRLDQINSQTGVERAGVALAVVEDCAERGEEGRVRVRGGPEGELALDFEAGGDEVEGVGEEGGQEGPGGGGGGVG